MGLLGTWNVFDGFASKGQVATDSTTLNISHISRDDTRLQIENEVREAYARLMNAQQNIQAQAANVTTAEESVRLAHVSADNGYATLLDVLQAPSISLPPGPRRSARANSTSTRWRISSGPFPSNSPIGRKAPWTSKPTKPRLCVRHLQLPEHG